MCEWFARVRRSGASKERRAQAKGEPLDGESNWTEKSKRGTNGRRCQRGTHKEQDRYSIQGVSCCVTGGGKEYLHNHPTVFVGDANCTHPVALACTTILFPGADVAQMVRLASPFLQSHQSYDVPERAWLVGAAVCRTVAEPACGREEAAGDADAPRPKDTETKAKDKATKAMRRGSIALYSAKGTRSIYTMGELENL